MQILIAIALIATAYLIIYGIGRLISTITSFLKASWVVVGIGCMVIIVYLRQNSFLNYVVVALTAFLVIRLLISQAAIAIEIAAGDATTDKESYRDAIVTTYAHTYAFLVFGTLYANLTYIIAVVIGGLSFEEYKEMSWFGGTVLSYLGLSPVKWAILILAGVAFVKSYGNAKDFDIECGKQKVKHDSPNALKIYFSKHFGINISPADNSLEASQEALKKHLLSLVKDAQKSEKLTNAVLNAASFEIEEKSELLESIVSDSGLTQDEVLSYFPALR